MISLNILNIRKFLEVVNECEGEIKMRCTDGSKVNIRRQYAVQNKLPEEQELPANYVEHTQSKGLHEHCSLLCRGLLITGMTIIYRGTWLFT